MGLAHICNITYSDAKKALADHDMRHKRQAHLSLRQRTMTATTRKEVGLDRIEAEGIKELEIRGSWDKHT